MNVLGNLRTTCWAGGDYPVALTDSGIITAEDLRRRALSLAAQVAARRETRWGIWLQSPGEFLVAFLGLALAGKHLVLPGNMQKGTARQLAPHLDGLLTDQKFEELDRVQLWPETPEQNRSVFQPQIEGHVPITLFTSGSTGEPKPIEKSLHLFEQELQLQQRQWGDRVGQLPVVATVSHQHIYGLLHAVLWPFLRRAPFVDGVCQYPEELAAKALEHKAVVLVSSPTHLARLPQAGAMEVAAERIRVTFSSGAPLPAEAAGALQKMLGHAPFEILGSTETGGVAWRQQGEDESWTALPGVEVQRDAETGCLAVRSPHLGQAVPYVMGDQVAVQEPGRFRLLGRADRVVKVEGKRLSITAMERHLQDCPEVSEARLVVVRGRREEVGAVVVLSAGGQALLEKSGKLALNRVLRQRLLSWFEPPLLPRRWRYVPRLPYNAQGKITAADLTAVLQREAQ